MCDLLHFRTKALKIAASFAALVASMPLMAQTQITDEAGLKSIANDLSGSYVLAADITLTGEWTPIGSESAPFTGTLEGNNHVIKGLTITSGDDNVGFFSYISGAKVQNVRFVSANVKGNKQAAVVAGQAKNSTLRGIFVSGVVTGYDHVGGICGDARGDASEDEYTYVTDCLSLVGAFSTTYQAGCVAGWTNAGVFTNCVALGSASAPSGGAGGMTSMVDNDGVGCYVNNVRLRTD